jgi:FtsH-binding integral membrane protein
MFMKLSRLIYVIAIIIIAAWLLGLVFRFAAWLINGLLYVAAIVLIIGLVANYLERRKQK